MTAWWDEPHNPRTLTRCTATLTDDPRTRCIRWEHDTTADGQDAWHTWSAVRWGTAPPDLLARGVVRTGPGRFTTVADLVPALPGDPR